MLVLRLYGQLSVHGDSVAQPLLLPDSPVVVWWPGEPPAVPAEDPSGGWVTGGSPTPLWPSSRARS